MPLTENILKGGSGAYQGVSRFTVAQFEPDYAKKKKLLQVKKTKKTET